MTDHICFFRIQTEPNDFSEHISKTNEWKGQGTES
jgi:hypothetical protein